MTETAPHTDQDAPPIDATQLLIVLLQLVDAQPVTIQSRPPAHWHRPFDVQRRTTLLLSQLAELLQHAFVDPRQVQRSQCGQLKQGAQAC